MRFGVLAGVLAGALFTDGLLASCFISEECRPEKPKECCPEKPKECCPLPNPCCLKVNRGWVSADYLLWKVQNSPEPVPLVTEGPNYAPAIGQPGTVVILGGKSVSTPWHSGGRLAMGFGFDQKWSLETRYFFLVSTSTKESVESSGLPGSENLGVPFFDVVTNAEAATAIATPRPTLPFSGLATLRVSNWMQGAELNMQKSCSAVCFCALDFLAGLRYWNFNESLTFSTSSPYVTLHDVYQTRDKFRTFNNFFGGQIGFSTNCACRCFTVNLTSKFAAGVNRGTVDTRGKFITNDFNGFGVPQGLLGGIFAQLTNIGKKNYTFFSFLPEAAVNVFYSCSKCFDVHLGYTFLFATNVLRPGNEMDRNINPTQSGSIEFTVTPSLVGPADPVPLHKTTTMWTQGLNAGVTLNF